jgi:hemerythrin
MFQLDVAQAWHEMFALHLRLYVSGVENQDYDVATIAKDSVCDLGQWINAHERQLAVLSNFAAVKDAHKEFHRVAAEMVREHQGGNTPAAQELFGGSFNTASSRVTAALQSLAEECTSHPELQPCYFSSFIKSEHDGFRFDESMHIGVPVIDEQHKIIASTASRLLQYQTELLTSESVSEILSQLQQLILQHFATEEMFMRTTRMPKEHLEAHAAEHTRIIGMLTQLQVDAMMRFSTVVSDIIKDIRSAVVDHVLGYDLNIKHYLP